ncbi:hypothetical protein LCGC14_0867080 [marine sediment metagenome]|uniref:Uncharacterized protein n=1 Tax=marine sediment metagenome TaxID=412755 RepID=A0A0F9SCR5_9ZZZZ
MEAKTVEVAEEFVAVQYLVSVELKFPFHEGKRIVNWLDITTSGENGVVMGKEELHIETDVDGLTEHIPRENVAKRRVKMYMIPQLEGYELGSYEYVPYTYPNRVGGYLGSYRNEKGGLAALGTDLRITMIKDPEA